MSGCTRRDCTTDMTIEEIDRLTLQAVRDYLDPLETVNGDLHAVDAATEKVMFN